MAYDPATNNGKVRLLIGDTDSAAYIFTDAEIDTFLTLAGSLGIYEAAAQAFETIARSKFHLAQKMQLGQYKTEEFAIDDALKAAQRLRELGGSGGIGVFEIGVSDDSLDSYRPIWANEDGTESV